MSKSVHTELLNSNIVSPRKKYSNPYTVTAPEYDCVRPRYPQTTLEQIVKAATQFSRSSGNSEAAILDIGAGTGIMTHQLVTLFGTERVIALEPSTSMRTELAQACPRIRILPDPLETAELPPQSIAVAVCAQSFHWLEPVSAAASFKRLIIPNGAVIVVNNQLDVSLPWVHRMTRIMRSGDVHRIGRPPRIESGFSTAQLITERWTQQLTPDQVMALARTRSSYLRSNRVNRARMQGNLRWYLDHHLTLHGEQLLALPYLTHTWIMRRSAP